MKICAGAVVRLDYMLRDATGAELDSSDNEPFEYLHGHGQLVAGLERQLEGRIAGEACHLTVQPHEGYGEHDPEQVQVVPRSVLPADLVPEVGLEIATEGADGDPVLLWISAIDAQNITLDANHPLAGQMLHFEIKLHDVRRASAAELACGHVHTGPEQLH